MIEDVCDTELEKKKLFVFLLLIALYGCRVLWHLWNFEGEANDHTVVKTKMNDYFVPKYNNEFERYISSQATQKEGENLDQFWTKLKN